ncbi:MAG: uracil-DNA glycosylase [Alphaproteobacteria bacterium]|nr:uracil-DNA glycosylase [Alphaproteobacteria bacterium]
MKLNNLNKSIVECRKCSRLVNFREKIAIEKRKQYQDEVYWGKPITGYGDKNAKLLMVGLAPAAHGGNRTGRVFTGDKSADFLFKCLYKAGFSNQSTSVERDDGLKLNNLYLTTALKCVPPEDKPKPEELKTCFNFFREEINYLVKINTIVALGKIAFDACLNFYMQDYDLKRKDFVFQHGTEYMLPDGKILIGSYHPSPRNVNTGRIDENKMGRLLKKVKKIMDR